jgi:hypothetical protein
VSSFWWIDRTLPGVVGSLIVGAFVGLSHWLLKRHITRTTERQDERIEQLTADQTAAITGQPQTPGGT